MDLEIKTRKRDGWSVLHVAGELDIATAGQLREVLIRALADLDAGVIVDLGDLGFCDASGLGALLDAGDTARDRGARLRFVFADGKVMRVLRLLELEQLLPVFPTVGAAMADMCAVPAQAMASDPIHTGRFAAGSATAA